MKKIAVLIILLVATSAHAVDRQATTCSRSDVYAKYQLSASGDRVLIPAGQCSWSQGITTNKSVSFIGAGKTSTIISGTFSDGYGGTSAPDSDFFFAIHPDSTSLIQVSGMTLESTGLSSGIRIDEEPETFRITDIKFNKLPLGVYIRGDVGNSGDGGVIDNCEFLNISGLSVLVIGPCKETWTRSNQLSLKKLRV